MSFTSSGDAAPGGLRAARPEDLSAVAFSDSTGLALLPYAVVDVETTGFSPVRDEIVEVAVVHFEVGAQPRIAVDSLVKPTRRVPNRAVHGISNRDVRRAPPFERIAGRVADALVGRVLVAHNATFDVAFLANAFGKLGVPFAPHTICTLKIARWLAARGIENPDWREMEPKGPQNRRHVAACDAQAAAERFGRQLHVLPSQKVETFGDYDAQISGSREVAIPLSAEAASILEGRDLLVPRAGLATAALADATEPSSERFVSVADLADPAGRATSSRAPVPARSPAEAYRRALEIEFLKGGAMSSTRVDLNLRSSLDRDTLAGIHALALAAVLKEEAAFGLTATSRERISFAMRRLTELGWAPGEE